MVKELEVYISTDDLGRAAIIQRSDRMLQIYVNWLWNEKSRLQLNVDPSMPRGWAEYHGNSIDLYELTKPEGLFDRIEDARLAVQSLPGFSGANLVTGR